MFELLNPTEMQRADALASSQFQVKSITLMEKAGEAVATEIMRRFSKRHVAVLCGPGNNGGDGFVVARLLAKRKWPVTVFVTNDVNTLKGDAAVMARRWRGRSHHIAALGELFAGKNPPGLIVDAIYGSGLNREFPKAWADAIAAAKLPIVAVDVPSGLDAATGRPIAASVAANVTVTFFRKKPGHVLLPGRDLCGEVVVADISLPRAVLDDIKPQAFENIAPVLPQLASNTYKFKRGHAVVFSGPELACGASRLAALAAARSGAGLVTLVGEVAALRIHATHVTSIMLKQAVHRDELCTLLSDHRITAICIGPGAGLTSQLHRNVLTVLKEGPACVLDADALSIFADKPDELFTAIQSRPGRCCVMTPHAGEFARIFPDLSDSIESKINIAREAANRSGAVMVLKGSDTVIAAPDGRAKVNTNAPAKLATAGSGDVLCGIITGLLAQGLPAFDAACAAVWLHSDAANRILRRNIIAEDLIANLGV